MRSRTHEPFARQLPAPYRGNPFPARRRARAPPPANSVASFAVLVLFSAALRLATSAQLLAAPVNPAVFCTRSVCILRSHHTRAIPHSPEILPMHRCRRILVAFYSTLVLSSTLAAYHLDATLCHACRPCGPLRPRPSHNCCPHHNVHKPHSHAGVPMHHCLRSRSFLRCIGASHRCLFGLPPLCRIAAPHGPVVPHARALGASVARITRPRPFTRPTA